MKYRAPVGSSMRATSFERDRYQPAGSMSASPTYSAQSLTGAGAANRQSPQQQQAQQMHLLGSTLHSTAYNQMVGGANGNATQQLPRTVMGRSGSSSALWRNEKKTYNSGLNGTKKVGNKTQSNSEDFRQRMQAREKKPKILFLDIDGVLHSIRVARQEQLFNPQKMALLRKLIASTDCQVVLSSAWRRTAPTLRMAYQMLQRHGIETPIDITPDFGICGKRSNEILTWVEKYGIRDWVAVDDLDLNVGEPRMRGHFLKCNPLIGLTNDLVEQGVTMLNGKD